MAFESSPYPPFSWSLTRARTLWDCPRRYLLRYYTGHGGWRSTADPVARRAWVLRHLPSLPELLGTALHECCRLCARAVRRQKSLPTETVLRQLVADRLNSAWRTRDACAFLAAPERHPMLREIYYGRGVDANQLQATRVKLDTCVQTLLSCPVWDELRRCLPADIRVIDAVSSMEIEGTTVYVAPDLIYRRRHGTWVLVDWKTGSSRGVSTQLALYGLYLERGMRVAFTDGACECRAYNLHDGDVLRFNFTKGDRDVALGMIRDSIGEMHGYLTSVDQNAPKAATEFEFTRRRSLCRSCPFLEFCSEGLRSLPSEP